MFRFSRYTASAAVALGLAALAGAATLPALAADPVAPASFDRMSRMCGDMDARMAAHAAYTETKLKLTEAQKVEFKRLTETMKSASEPMRKLCADKTTQAQPATLPERMTRMQTMLEARLDSMHKMLPAMTAFYKTLTPEQQKVADEMMPGGRGHGHGPAMMHH